MDEPSKARKPRSQWLRNNLVTIGSAAVFTVYSAGYFRTRERGPALRGRMRCSGTLPPRRRRRRATHRCDGRSLAEPGQRAVVPTHRRRDGDSEADRESGPSRSEAATRAGRACRTDRGAAGVAGGRQRVRWPRVASHRATTAPAPVPVAAAPVPAARRVPRRTPDPAAAAARRTSAAENQQLKDGTFNGWGTSRHGDIQAAVEIKNGRIVGAYISQCLTRYSCSWISALPPGSASSARAPRSTTSPAPRRAATRSTTRSSKRSNRRSERRLRPLRRA